MLKKNKKIFVGMSGGVDSSVSALLLKNQGFEVIGVFIKVWQPDFIECTWREDRRDALRICAQLDIPFITLDLEKEYKKGVIDYMISEYKSGRTPNPDVFCNKEVKFGAFLKWALKNGADYIATGHYAQNKNLFLWKGKDVSKDQSYFLYTLNTSQLKSILFPVGGLLKSEIREIAKKNNLFTAQKKDSQGLCFIGRIEIKDFLKTFIKEKPGQVFDLETQKQIGIHNGTFFYTIGEKTHGKYIVKKDINKNILYVLKDMQTPSKQGSKKKIFLEQVNFLKVLEIGNIYSVAERYHSKETKIKIVKVKEKISKKTMEIEYEFANKKDIEFVYTPGQALVFYKKNQLLGGGILV